MIFTLLKKKNISVDLTGLNWGAAGDSITYYNIYQPIVKSELGLSTVYNSAISGKPIVNHPVYGGVCLLVDDLFQYNIDIISVWAGTNDWQQLSAIGNDNDTVNTTVKGAVNYIVSQVAANKPNAFLFFIITPQRWHWQGEIDGFEIANSNGLKLTDINSAIKTRCLALNVPYLDLYNHPQLPYSGVVQPPTTTPWSDDGLHPNTYGYGIAANLISDFLQKNYR